MDHYKTLGLGRSATKDEIKAAFRRCALEFHPDRHSQSTQAARDRATSRFKQASEAYEVLIDDGKRAVYDRGGGGGGPFGGRTTSGYNGGGRHYGYGYGYGSGGGAAPGYGSWGEVRVEWDAVFRYLTSRRFALNAFYASALLCGTIIIERTGEALWEMNNSGKSFEEAMESIEKIKMQKDDN